MNIGAINQFNLQEAAKDPEVRQQQLEAVSKEFEAVLTATLLKEGLSSAKSMNPDEGDSTYKEFAYEQLAYHIGRQNVLNLSQQLTQQLNAIQPGESL